MILKFVVAVYLALSSVHVHVSVLIYMYIVHVHVYARFSCLHYLYTACSEVS